MAACWVHIKGGSLSLARGRDTALCVTKDAWIIGQLVTLVQMHVVFVRACLSLPLPGSQSDETIKKWRTCTLRSHLFNQDRKFFEETSASPSAVVINWIQKHNSILVFFVAVGSKRDHPIR